MKRLSLAMMGLAVAGLMTMVSCRKPVNQFNPTGEKITFSATTENNSKTYAEDVDGELYVKWSEDDEIRINGNEDANLFEIGNIRDNGTKADFTGLDVVAVEGGYLASYPKTATNNGTSVTFNVPKEQKDYNNSDDDHDLMGVLPMAAYTEEKGGNLQFKNMVNILQLNLTGNQSINTIEVESANEYLSGNFTVGTNLEPNYINNYNDTKKITITKDMMLSQTPLPVYVLLPVFKNASSQISIKFTGDEGTMTIAGITLPDSNTPSHRYNGSALAVKLDIQWNAIVETLRVCAVHANCASSGGKVYDFTAIGVSTPDEQGVIWAKTESLGGNELTFENYESCGGGKYVFNYKYADNLTPKKEFIHGENGSYTAFMSGLESGTNYTYRAYIRKGTKVLYDEEDPKMENFTTLSSEPDPSIEEVDFGLEGHDNLKWAKYNLGVNVDKITNNFASAVSSDWYGDYYMWGDNAACNTPASQYSTQFHPGDYCQVYCCWYSYRFAANITDKFTKYCETSMTSNWYPSGSPDNNLELDPADDCVYQTLGGDWRLPTVEEWEALRNGSLWVFTGHYNGKSDPINKYDLRGYVVYKVKDPSHKGVAVLSDGDGNGGYSGYSEFTYGLSDTHIFLPAAGYREKYILSGHSTSNYNLWYGCYLSSSLFTGNWVYSDRSQYMSYFLFGTDNGNPYFPVSRQKDLRYYGMSVRPVKP